MIRIVYNEIVNGLLDKMYKRVVIVLFHLLSEWITTEVKTRMNQLVIESN